MGPTDRGRTFRRATLAAAAILCLLAAGPSRAQDGRAVQNGPAEPLWRVALYKTFTFESAANAADIALFALFFGGGAATAAGFFAVNTASAAVLYYAHEIAWDRWGPPVETENETAVAGRKTLTHRAVSVTRNLALGGLFGGGLGQTLGFTVTGQVVDATLYFINERVWRIYGPPIAR